MSSNTVENTFSGNINAKLTQVISISEIVGKRTHSTTEFTCSIVHYISGEMSDNLEFRIYRKDKNNNKIYLFYSELNPQNKVISSNGSIERKEFFRNNFNIIIDDLGVEASSVELWFEMKSDSQNYNFYAYNLVYVYSAYIKDLRMEGSIDIKGLSINNIIPYFQKSISLEWPAATEYVDSSSTSGYILSYSIDGGLSWFENIITGIRPVNDKCLYSFNIESIPNDAVMRFKVKCFNGLNPTSNELISDIVYKCNFNPVSDIVVSMYDKEGNALKSLENRTKKINISYKGSTCSNKDGFTIGGLKFWYSIIFPDNFIIYQGQQPSNIYSFSEANETSLDINIIDSQDEIPANSTELFILRDKLNTFLGEEIIKNVNFIIQTELVNSENGTSATVKAYSSFLINLYGYEISSASNLNIYNDNRSSVYKNINSKPYLIPDGEGFIYLDWDEAVNPYNPNDTFLYDIYIGIDGVYTYENTTSNTNYQYKMKKVDKKTILSFYLITRNNYTSVKSEFIPQQEVHFYDKPCLNTFNLERTVNACTLFLSFDIETSIEDLLIKEVSLSIDNAVPGSIVGVPESKTLMCKEEIRCDISNLVSTSSYTLTLNYTDNSGITNIITEQFKVPAAAPIMEVTPECITMGGAPINNDFILNVKGNANIDGSIIVKPYEINALVDDINSFKDSGNYVCDFDNAQQIVHLLPLTEPGSFTIIVVGGFVPIQFLIYTQFIGDNSIYMRNYMNDAWSEWVLLHAKSSTENQ